MKLINLTPHPVQIWNIDKGVVLIPAANPAARCHESVSNMRLLEHECSDIKVVDLSYDYVYNLPESQEGVFYIVSVLVAQARPERDDLLVPYDLVRNENGSIMGCRSLARIK